MRPIQAPVAAETGEQGGPTHKRSSRCSGTKNQQLPQLGRGSGASVQTPNVGERLL